MSDSSGDIVERLRAWRDERGFPTPGEMMDEAIAEISRLRITDEEREAIESAAKKLKLLGDAYDPERAAILRGLLERL